MSPINKRAKINLRDIMTMGLKLVNISFDATKVVPQNRATKSKIKSALKEFIFNLHRVF